MSDLGEKDGGETVFTEAWPVPVGQVEEDGVDEETVSYQKVHESAALVMTKLTFVSSKCQALLHLRESQEGSLLKKDSWEEGMVRKSVISTGLIIGIDHACSCLTFSGGELQNKVSNPS